VLKIPDHNIMGYNSLTMLYTPLSQRVLLSVPYKNSQTLDENFFLSPGRELSLGHPMPVDKMLVKQLGNSSGLKPIENVGALMKSQLTNCHISHLEELK
jgi:hypothetical protein